MSKPVPLYQLTPEDCATPSFCSASKPYFGTQKQILRLLARRASFLLRSGQGTDVAAFARSGATPVFNWIRSRL